MAIAAQWQTVATVTTGASTVYTIPSGTASAYGVYARDLVVTNSGVPTVFLSLTPAGAAAATTLASFAIPSGGTVILTQCQVPAGANLSAITSSGTASVSVGFGTNVSYV